MMETFSKIIRERTNNKRSFNKDSPQKEEGFNAPFNSATFILKRILSLKLGLNEEKLIG
jgi:hypothetical protein